jgi:hypothetical protein
MLQYNGDPIYRCTRGSYSKKQSYADNGNPYQQKQLPNLQRRHLLLPDRASDAKNETILEMITDRVIIRKKSARC